MPQTRMSKAASDRARWLQVLKGYDRGFTKLGELGGDGQDIPFEQAFSNLAHAYLRDKAPTLLDHEVGFQLLDRNQENTKAIGVFGFKVGSHWLYAPAFFLNGDLKGHELLYLKNQDMFVPLKENWLNYILNRKPNILGDGVDRNSSQFGVRQPDFSRMTHSPYKYSSAKPSLREMVDAVKPAFAHCATLNTKQAFDEIGGALNLPKFLKEAGLQMIEKLVSTCQDYPVLGEAIEEFHGLQVVSDAIKTASARRTAVHSILDEPEQVVGSPRYITRQELLTGSILDEPKPLHPIKTGALKVITFDLTTQDELPEGISEEERDKLLTGQPVVKDLRTDEDVSIAYREQVEQKLYNPTESGLYEILVKSGDFERCYVLLHPQGADRRMSFATVIRITGDDGARNWANMPTTEIWAGSKIEGKEFDSWYDGLPEAKSLSKGRSNYVVLGPRGEGTVPFSVQNELGEEQGATVYEVDLNDHHHFNRPIALSYPMDPMEYDRYRDGCRIHLNGKQGTALRVHYGDIFVPEGYKMLKVKHDKFDDMTEKEKEDYYRTPCCGPYGSSEEKPIRPGNLLDVQLLLMQKTAALTIYDGGSEVEINRQRMRPLDAMISLVRDHGLREAAARQLLKEAAKHRKFKCRIKYASPYLTDSGPTAPAIPEPAMSGSSIMGNRVPTQMGVDQSVPVEGVGARRSDLSVYNPDTALDRKEVSTIQQAAQSGQKEIFDTAMIGSMLKAVRDDSMVDRFLGDLTKGMDRLGRILFMFYWHGDEFAERYGKADMPELEDSLRNSFESLGDVILFLKQKTIEPYPEEGQMDIDLAGAASA